MKKILKYIILNLVFMFPFAVTASSDLTSVASVNITSDTASNAKIMAFDEARRQIIEEVLSGYTDSENSEKIVELIKITDNAKLTNLISSTNIDNERLSATTYSANIKMTIDIIEAKKWLAENDIQNWLNNELIAVDKITVVIDVADGLRDWINLNRAIQAENLNMEIKRISGNQITVTIPVTDRSGMLLIIRNAGWRYSRSNGFIKIWK